MDRVHAAVTTAPGSMVVVREGDPCIGVTCDAGGPVLVTPGRR